MYIVRSVRWSPRFDLLCGTGNLFKIKNMPAQKGFDIKSLLPTFLWISLVVAAFFIGSLVTKVQYLEKSAKTAAAPTPQAQAPQPAAIQPTLDQVKDAYTKSAIKLGDLKRKLVFLEIADPSCPYCHIAAGKDSELNKQVGDQFKLVADGGTYVAPVPEMKKLLDQGKASFAYIYFPGHGNGEMATKALYCAFEKGKFWEVHDLLMSNAGYNTINTVVKNDKTKSGDLAAFLKPVFDAGTMKGCLDSGKYDSRLNEDVKLASSLGITGTPGFFVNAINFSGAYSFANMESAVNDAFK